MDTLMNVTPSDTDALPFPVDLLYVGTSGAVAFEQHDGTKVVVCVAAGEPFSLGDSHTSKVFADGTTAQNIVGRKVDDGYLYPPAMKKWVIPGYIFPNPYTDGMTKTGWSRVQYELPPGFDAAEDTVNLYRSYDLDVENAVEVDSGSDTVRTDIANPTKPAYYWLETFRGYDKATSCYTDVYLSCQANWPLQTNLAVASKTSTSVSLTWHMNGPSTNGIYYVTRLKRTQGVVVTSIDLHNESSYTDTGLLPNTAYSYQIFLLYTDEDGATFESPAANPTPLSVTTNP